MILNANAAAKRIAYRLQEGYSTDFICNNMRYFICERTYINIDGTKGQRYLRLSQCWVGDLRRISLENDEVVTDNMIYDLITKINGSKNKYYIFADD